MTDQVDDGGPAFPRVGFFPAVPPGDASAERLRREAVTTPQPGMTLRDYFAGQALAGHLATNEKPTSWVGFAHTLAKACYEIADALLKARGPASGGDRPQ